MNDNLINQLICFFEKFNAHKIGTWFLDRETLLEFVINNRITGKIQIGIIECKKEAFQKKCESFGVSWEKKSESKKKVEYGVKISVLDGRGKKEVPMEVRLYKELDRGLICAPQQVIDDIQKQRDTTMSRWGTWKFQMVYNKWFNPSIPYKFGTILDMEMPDWINKVKYVEKENPNKENFFTGKRVENALELMTLLRECAIKAEIEDYLFVGFGTLLGIAREGDFIQTDRDLDHCIMGPHVTQKAEEVFLQEIARARTIKGKVYPKGLYEGRKKTPLRRRDNTRFLWTSCGHKRVHGQKGIKSCVWKWFRHDGYDWHSKGRRWVNTNKFQEYNFKMTEDAIAKGIPKGLLDKFIEIDFKGIKVNIPLKVGSCLDVWYPGWARPKKGASEKKHVLVIPSWKNPYSWKMV